MSEQFVDASGITRLIGELDGGGGSQPEAKVTLSSAQILAIDGTRVQLVAAPGAGKLVVLSSLTFYAKGGSHPNYAQSPIEVYYGADTTAVSSSNFFTSAPYTNADRVNTETPFNNTYAAGVAIDAPLMLGAAGIQSDGPLLTTSLNAGGSGYAPGDTGEVGAPYGDTNATYVVDTVDGGGAVLTYHIDFVGAAGYRPGSVRGTSVLTGGGDGQFKVNVLTVTPGNSTLVVVAGYTIRDLS